jgi:hypothetical protein
MGLLDLQLEVGGSWRVLHWLEIQALGRNLESNVGLE